MLANVGNGILRATQASDSNQGDADGGKPAAVTHVEPSSAGEVIAANPATTNDTLNVARADRRRYHLAAYSTLANLMSKGISLVVLYVSVPLTLSYLGAARFGVWMTLVSLMSLMASLDFGISSSLLNRVAHSSVTETQERLNRLITHGLAALAAVGLLLMAILFAVVQFLPLRELFNVAGQVELGELRAAARSVVLLVGISLPLGGVERVFLGRQRAFVFHLAVGVGNFASLLVLLLLVRQKASIGALLLGIYGVRHMATLPLLLLLIRRRLFGCFARQEFLAELRELVQNGILFFVLNIGAALTWDSDFLILAHISGAAAVTTYAVGVRLFQLVELPLQMANAPLWPAYADAYARGSRDFLRRTLLWAVLLTFAAALVGSSGLVLLHEPIIRIWIHQAVTLSWGLVATMGLWTLLRASGNSFAMYLNGVKVVKPQVIAVTVFCAVNLPLKVYLGRRMGGMGVSLAGIVSYLAAVVLPYLTFYRRDWTQSFAGTQTKLRNSSPSTTIDGRSSANHTGQS